MSAPAGSTSPFGGTYSTATQPDRHLLTLYHSFRHHLRFRLSKHRSNLKVMESNNREFEQTLQGLMDEWFNPSSSTSSRPYISASSNQDEPSSSSQDQPVYLPASPASNGFDTTIQNPTIRPPDDTPIPDSPATSQILRALSGTRCRNCGNLGHPAVWCPGNLASEQTLYFERVLQCRISEHGMYPYGTLCPQCQQAAQNYNPDNDSDGSNTRRNLERQEKYFPEGNDDFTVASPKSHNEGGGDAGGDEVPSQQESNTNVDCNLAHSPATKANLRLARAWARDRKEKLQRYRDILEDQKMTPEVLRSEFLRLAQKGRQERLCISESD